MRNQEVQLKSSSIRRDKVDNNGIGDRKGLNRSRVDEGGFKGLGERVSGGYAH